MLDHCRSDNGATICAIDMVDCIKPIVIPCRCRATALVMRLVRLGRSTALPKFSNVMANKR